MKFVLVALAGALVFAPAPTRADTDADIKVARYYVAKHNHLAALNRLKLVLTQFQTSQHAEEALARIAESYLALGAVSEAQTAVAVLDRKFPGGRWAIQARAVLKSAGLEPAENGDSWISRAFRQ